MKGKIFKTIIAAAVAIMALVTTAYAETGDVEIRFSVGDDILTINGEQVQVEKPYIVGDGVTLVPVRVITEAFGAKVDWEQSTKTVTLDYPEVKIILQIGNLVAEVNGKAINLESAPELTDAGFTMVPLRFISENFGADVTYDHATAGIVVTKTATETGGTVEGAVDSEFIGDSFYDWYMETPDDMIMDTRYFDGTYTSFAYDDNNWISISIYSRDEDYDFNSSFQDTKSYFSNYTITKADKGTIENDVQYMHIQAKDRETMADYYEFVTDNYLYCISGGFDVNNTEICNEGLRILSTFRMGYNSDAYDLSNAKDGVRTFEVESMKLSFDVPKEYIMLSDEESETSFVFCSGLPDDDYSMIIGEIYSKDSAGSAKEFARRDLDRNMKYCNEDVVKFENEVTTINYNNITAYQYCYEVNATDRSEYNVDAFFEVGEYVYNFHITTQLPSDTYLVDITNFMNSIKAEALDPDEVGVILYTNEEDEGTYSVDVLNKCKMTIPNAFKTISESKTASIYSNGSVTIMATILMDEDYTKEDVRKLADSLVTAQRKIDGVSIKQLPVDRTYGANKFTTYSYKTVEEDMVAYSEVYIIEKNSCIYVFEVTYDEVAYSEHARDVIKTAIQSTTFK